MKCCFIPCEADADFAIHSMRDGSIAGPAPYSDEVHACESHVGALLGYQPNAEKPEEIYWQVTFIGTPDTSFADDLVQGLKDIAAGRGKSLAQIREELAKGKSV